MDLLAEMSWSLWAFSILIIGVCCFLMLVVLIQRGRGSGLAGAFGGAGGSSAFGAKTGDILTWVTVVVAAIFILLTSVANHAFDQSPQANVPAVATGTPEEPVGSGPIPISSLPIEAVPVTPSPDGTTVVPIGVESTPVQIPPPAGQQPADSEGSATPPGGENAGATPPPAGDAPAEAAKPGDAAKPAEEKKDGGDNGKTPEGSDQDKPTP